MILLILYYICLSYTFTFLDIFSGPVIIVIFIVVVIIVMIGNQYIFLFSTLIHSVPLATLFGIATKNANGVIGKSTRLVVKNGKELFLA